VTSPQDIEWLEPLVERGRNRELERYARRVSGLVPPYAGYFADCPWILRADLDLDIGFVEITDIAGLIYLVVSRDSSCRFCYSGSRLLMRMMGMTEDQILKVEHAVDAKQLDPRTTLALDFARKISRSNPPPDGTDKKALRDAGFSNDAIREIAFMAADVVFHNRFASLLALPPRPAERMSRSWLIGLFRFRFKRLLERVGTAVKPEALSDELKAGPYTELVLSLDGLAQARVLRHILDEAWASPHLSARTKALVFAVIARGLGSLPAEREAYRLLAKEGLESQQVEEILAHLASPDPIEARILPYVRETLWYQPATAQRRGRELRETLGNARLLETVGVAALANMVCRLAMVLEEPARQE
jgi:alkylhydroperoxidase family enzyme